MSHRIGAIIAVLTLVCGIVLHLSSAQEVPAISDRDHSRIGEESSFKEEARFQDLRGSHQRLANPREVELVRLEIWRRTRRKARDRVQPIVGQLSRYADAQFSRCCRVKAETDIGDPVRILIPIGASKHDFDTARRREQSHAV